MRRWTRPASLTGAAPAQSPWVRIYANREHVFAIIAGLRWDTSFSDDGDRKRPRLERIPCAPPAASASATRSASSALPP